MVKDVAEGLFLETAEVHNNVYGTSRKAVQDTLAAGKVAILDVGEWLSVSWVSHPRHGHCASSECGDLCSRASARLRSVAAAAACSRYCSAQRGLWRVLLS